jgi:hypothetical protein
MYLRKEKIAVKQATSTIGDTIVYHITYRTDDETSMTKEYWIHLELKADPPAE